MNSNYLNIVLALIIMFFFAVNVNAQTINETFDDGSLSDGNPFTWTQDNNYYTIQNGKLTYSTSLLSLIAINQQLDLDNFTIEYSIKFNSTTTSTFWHALQFRKSYTSDSYLSSGYMVMFRQNGQLVLYANKNTGSSSDNYLGVYQTTKVVGDVSIIKVVAQGSLTQGSLIKVYIDGTEVISVNDDTYNGGYCGFTTNQSSIEVDYISITPGSITYSIATSVIPAGTISDQAGGWITTDPEWPYDANQNVTLTAVPNSGYQFSEWQGDLSGSTNPTIITMDGNKNVTAVFEEIPTYYTVTPSSGGNGLITPADPQSVEEGGSIQFTATANSGYVFKHFLIDGTTAITENPYTITNVIADKTIQVVFEEIPPTEYTITPSDDGNGTISPSTVQTVTEGQNIQFTATPNEGYVFKHFLIDGITTPTQNPYTITNVTSNKTIQAVFESAAAYTYTVTPSSGGNGTIYPSEVQTVNGGSEIQFTATPDEGYLFKHFIVNGVSVYTTNPYTMTNIIEDKTIQAVFELIPPNTYLVTPAISGNGFLTPGSPQQVTEGNDLQILATATLGATFDHFEIVGSATETVTTNPYTISNITENLVVNVYFTGGVESGGSSVWSVNETDIFYTDGKVSIGTEAAPEKLNVGGKIMAEEVVVKLSDDWPDYVFSEGYELTPLADIEKFINENKHLPGIPSSGEVSEQGVLLGDMQVKYLKVIEELYLHVIKNKREIEDLRAKLESLKKTK